MKVEIVSPEKVMWSGDAASVIVPSHNGDLGILPRRQPVLAVLQPGTVRITPVGGGEQLSFAVTGGFVSVDDRVEIVVETVDATLDE